MSNEENNQNNNDNENLDLSQFKIFPRNLTAYADYNVKGNPPITRPESGVDNCFPGLELDQRNLEQKFFPGLTFEFHHGSGAKLVDITDKQFISPELLKEDDLTGNNELYLRAMIGGRTSNTDEENLIRQFVSRNENEQLRNWQGLRVWRYIHDLLPGKLGLLIKSGRSIQELNDSEKESFSEAFKSNTNIEVKRNDNGSIQYIIIIGERAKYLDEYGVIDIESYDPGDLTKSLCSPWQYDFRECNCSYWASNKPDIVVSADSTKKLNFLRKDRDSDHSQTDIRKVWYGVDELEHNELIAGEWNKLPIVIDDKEEDEDAISENPT